MLGQLYISMFSFLSELGLSPFFSALFTRVFKTTVVFVGTSGSCSRYSCSVTSTLQALCAVKLLGVASSLALQQQKNFKLE